MKQIKGMQLGTVLAAMLMLSIAFVPAVNANSDKKGPTEKEIIIGKGGVTQSKVPTLNDDTVGILATGKHWTVTTDIWFSTFTGLHSDHYSQSRDNETAWNINKISVRGRAWQDNVIKMDKKKTRFNSSDAKITKIACGSWHCGGSWKARGDHKFVQSGYQSWYPTTSDTWR